MSVPYKPFYDPPYKAGAENQRIAPGTPSITPQEGIARQPVYVGKSTDNLCVCLGERCTRRRKVNADIRWRRVGLRWVPNWPGVGILCPRTADRGPAGTGRTFAGLPVMATLPYMAILPIWQSCCIWQSCIHGNPVLHGNPVTHGNSVLHGNSSVHGNPVLHGNSTLYGNPAHMAFLSYMAILAIHGNLPSMAKPPYLISKFKVA